MNTPEEIDHLYIEDLTEEEGPSVLPEGFPDPARGVSPTGDTRFTRLLLTRTRIVPVAAEFFRRSREFEAMRDLQGAAGRVADTTRTDPMTGRAVLLKAVADRYLNHATA